MLVIEGYAKYCPLWKSHLLEEGRRLNRQLDTLSDLLNFDDSENMETVVTDNSDNLMYPSFKF